MVARSIQIIVPPDTALRSGNQRTAAHWARDLSVLGYQVEVGEVFNLAAKHDLVIALHASKTFAAQRIFRTARKGGKLIVVLTGTDIYPEPDDTVLRSMEDADRLVVLQSHALNQVPKHLHHKTRVIVQSAVPMAEAARRSDFFDLCLVGHLRPVKEPMLGARAVMDLPADSKVRMFHAGSIIEPNCPCRQEIQALQDNDRYIWMGELSPERSRQLMADCRLMLLCSRAEGGAHVLGESIVEGTPVLATRIDASCALLGDDYPGLFEVGDQAGLTALIHRAETEPDFYQRLAEMCNARVEQFHPQHEMECLRSLVESLNESEAKA